MTPLCLLNFLVLQWFGVRLARVIGPVYVASRRVYAGQLVSTSDVHTELRQVGWKWLRWIVPLSGWWSDFRWIARRS